MKNHLMRMVLTAGLTLLGSLSLSAQNNREIAKIPFAFQANQNSFSAGDYSIDRLTDTGVFRLLSKADLRSIFVNAHPSLESKGEADPHLTFACYQGDCVLSQIWMGNTGYLRPQGSVDRDLQRKLGVATMISVRLMPR